MLMHCEGSLSVRNLGTEKVYGMQGPRCNDQMCNDNRMYRIRRKGFLQKLIYPLFGYYPWKCRHCEKTQMKKDRGERIREI